MKKLVLFLFITCSLGAFTSCGKDSETPEPIKEETSFLDVSYGVDAKQKMDIYLPKGRLKTSTKLIVLIHGGFWIGGDKTEFNFGSDIIPLVKQYFPDFAIFNLNYRLHTVGTATNPFPTQEQDIKAAMDYIYANIDSYDISNGTYILGASAGAHLGALYALKNNSNGRIQGCVNIAGPTDLLSLHELATSSNTIVTNNITGKALLESILGGTPTTKAELYNQMSPIKHISASTPKFLILHGEQDLVVPVSQAVAFDAALGAKATYFTYSGGHGLPTAPAAQLEAILKIQSFIK